MANNVSAAKPAVGGAISVAPAGTTLPTDATTALAAAFTKLGYITEDGMTNSNNINTETIKAWGGDEVLVINQGREDSFQYTLMDALSVDVLKQVYGGANVTGTLATGISIAVKSNIDMPEQVIVADMVLKDGTLKRIVVPCGKVSEVGDITYSDSDAIGYETTIKAIPDSSGNTHYEYIHAATGATGETGETSNG